MTTVVNCRTTNKFDVYIGRPSKWGNPFSHQSSSIPGTIIVPTRKEAIKRYEEYIRTRPDLMAAAKIELRGKVLACWCNPLPCHGHILAKIADED